MPDPPPFTITARDPHLLGTANQSDPLGFLAVWSARGRDLVPHLTEQTNHIRGFQILVEAFRLWSLYEPDHPQHAGRLPDFFLVVEQAYARTLGKHDTASWVLPGARRVRARAYDEPYASLEDKTLHLLGGQLANGIWGLYRGAARRAELLDEAMTSLSGPTAVAAAAHPCLTPRATKRLFALVEEAFAGETVALPTHLKNALASNLLESFREVPLRDHLQRQLVKAHELNRELSARVSRDEQLDHRAVLTAAARDLPQHRTTIDNVIACENLLAVVESVFVWLGAHKGQPLEQAVEDMPIDLQVLDHARMRFGHSGTYEGTAARSRHDRLYDGLATSNKAALARSILEFHESVCKARGRAVWIWEEDSLLRCDMEFDKPSASYFEVGVAWRNDYYLHPLRNITLQLEEARA